MDLESAGIPYADASDDIVDFHALRHQFISNLAAAGVHPKTAQELARHSDIKLTMNRHTHVFRGDLDKAVELVPDYGAEQARQAAQTQATGADNLLINAVAKQNENGLAFCLALSGDKPRTLANSVGHVQVRKQNEEKSIAMLETSVNMDDLTTADGGIRTCNLRFTKPLLCH